MKGWNARKWALEGGEDPRVGGAEPSTKGRPEGRNNKEGTTIPLLLSSFPTLRRSDVPGGDGLLVDSKGVGSGQQDRFVPSPPFLLPYSPHIPPCPRCFSTDTPSRLPSLSLSIPPDTPSRRSSCSSLPRLHLEPLSRSAPPSTSDRRRTHPILIAFNRPFTTCPRHRFLSLPPPRSLLGSTESMCSSFASSRGRRGCAELGTKVSSRSSFLPSHWQRTDPPTFNIHFIQRTDGLSTLLPLSSSPSSTRPSSAQVARPTSNFPHARRPWQLQTLPRASQRMHLATRTNQPVRRTFRVRPKLSCTL